MGFPPKIPLGSIPGVAKSLRELVGRKPKIEIQADLEGVRRITIDGTEIMLAPRHLPRAVHAFTRDLEPLVAVAQSVIGMDHDNVAIIGNVVPTEVGWQAAGSGAVDIFGAIFRRKQHQQATKDLVEVTWGRFGNFHQILDPTAVAASTIIAQDLNFSWFLGTTGTVDYYFGFYDFNTALDPTSLVGIGFRCTNGATPTWITYVRTGTGTPSTVEQETDTGIDVIAEHRLGIVLDAKGSQALFYIDGTLVDAYAPAAAPAQFGTAGTKFGYAGIVDGAGAPKGELSHRYFGGGNPKVLSTLREVL